jgi:hypothetical protein
MKAFLKRRWILLTCAVVLLACSVFDLHKGIFSTSENGTSFQWVGLWRGMFIHERKPWRGDRPEDQPELTRLTTDVHEPRFGGGAVFELLHGGTALIIPLWLPLSVVLGWLVIREFRYREKRAKLTEVQPEQ